MTKENTMVCEGNVCEEANTNLEYLFIFYKVGLFLPNIPLELTTIENNGECGYFLLPSRFSKL